MMRVVIAPDSFKGSLDAASAARAIADGWLEERPADRIVLRPMADGGEGTLDAFALAAPGARRMPVRVTGALGDAVDTAWLLLPPTAEWPRGTGVVELAATCGIESLGNHLAPWDASTFGFGQAVAVALDHGVSRLVLGIGSSASTDGGVGFLRALGKRFVGHDGREIAPGARGLADLAGTLEAGLRPPPDGGAVVLCVGSASSALSAFRLVGFCWPPSEPDVPIPEHPALRVIMPMLCSSMVLGCGFRDTGSGPL